MKGELLGLKMSDSLDKDHLEKEYEAFLTLSAKPEIRVGATEHLLGLTGSDDGIRFIKSSTKLLEGITSLIQDTNETVLKNVYKILINLGINSDVYEKILNMKTFSESLKDIMAKALDPEFPLADLVFKLFSNLTRTEACAKIVYDIVFSQDETIDILRIVMALCNLEYSKHSNLHYLAAVIGNLSQLQVVRDQLLVKDQWVIQRLLPFTEYKDSKVRRHGVVSCLKNCSFDSDYHEWLLSDKVDILPHLLLPLAGPEEFDDDDMEKLPDDLQYLPPDKKREEDPEIRKMLTEAVFRFCTTTQGRQFLRAKNTYVIMREYYNWEEVPANLEAIMTVIDVMIKDEEDYGDTNFQTYEISQKHLEQLEKEKNA